MSCFGTCINCNVRYLILTQQETRHYSKIIIELNWNVIYCDLFDIIGGFYPSWTGYRQRILCEVQQTNNHYKLGCYTVWTAVCVNIYSTIYRDFQNRELLCVCLLGRFRSLLKNFREIIDIFETENNIQTKKIYPLWWNQYTSWIRLIKDIFIVSIKMNEKQGLAKTET